MSRHSQPEPTYMPTDAINATHVYIKVDKPDNLGVKYQGPFLIKSRPSPTTLLVKVGYDIQGNERIEQHHWHNCQPAYLRTDQAEAQRPKRGRPAKRSVPHDVSFTTEASKQTQRDLAENLNALPARLAQHEEVEVTQPRTSTAEYNFQTPAELADVGDAPPPPTKTCPIVLLSSCPQIKTTTTPCCCRELRQA